MTEASWMAMLDVQPCTLPASWVILTGHNKAIRFSFADAICSTIDGRPLSMDFAVYEAAFGGGINEPGEWWLDEGNSGLDLHLHDWERAFAEISGGLKWDGCINWSTNDARMMHGCGPRHATVIADIFATIYHVGKRHMDLLGDEVQDMPANVIEVAE